MRTGFLPIAGSLGDRLSKTRVFIAGMVVFMLTSLGCALAVNVPMLIAFRALQARGGAGLSTRNAPTAINAFCSCGTQWSILCATASGDCAPQKAG